MAADTKLEMLKGVSLFSSMRRRDLEAVERLADTVDVPAGMSSGRLEGISVPDLMWSICRRRRTGVLHVTRGATTAPPSTANCCEPT